MNGYISVTPALSRGATRRTRHLRKRRRGRDPPRAASALLINCYIYYLQIIRIHRNVNVLDDAGNYTRQYEMCAKYQQNSQPHSVQWTMTTFRAKTKLSNVDEQRRRLRERVACGARAQVPVRVFLSASAAARSTQLCAQVHFHLQELVYLTMLYNLLYKAVTAI